MRRLSLSVYSERGRWPELKMEQFLKAPALACSPYGGQFETRTGGLACIVYYHSVFLAADV